MSLILELVSTGAAPSLTPDRKVFSEAGGTIGRAKHSDWVLPDNKVSARHARILCESSRFYIEDTSTNGTFLNSLTNRLVRGSPQVLEAGDRIIIEPYEIRVAAVDIARVPGARADDRPQPSGTDLTLGEPFDVGRAVPMSPGASGTSASHDSFDRLAPGYAGDDIVDPLLLLGGGPAKPSPPKPAVTARDLDAASPLEAHYRPPPVVPPSPPTPAPAQPSHLIPANYDPLAPDTHSGVFDVPALEPAVESPPAVDWRPDPVPDPAPDRGRVAGVAPAVPATGDTPSAAPPRAPSQASGGGGGPAGIDLAAVLAGAGLPDVDVTPEMARSFGEILRVVVAGVMDVLQSRHHVKDEFRMQMTQVRVADNNPLKFSVNVDDALHNLLVKRNAAYLGPVDAFKDAFDDLRNHQLAMLAGMRVAFEATLAALDPDRLEEQFERQVKPGALLGMAAKLRYWDFYRARRDELARDPELRFRSLFGEAFAEAYEAQLKRLKEQQRRT